MTEQKDNPSTLLPALATSFILRLLTFLSVLFLGPPTSLAAGLLAFITIALPAYELLCLKRGALIKRTEGTILVDLLLILFAGLLGGNHFLYLLPLAVSRAVLIVSAKEALLFFTLATAGSTTIQFIRQQPYFLPKAKSASQIVFQFLSSTDCLPVAAALLAVTLTALCAREYLKGTLNKMKLRAWIIEIEAAWFAMLIGVNILTNAVKFRGEEPVETNIHTTCLLITFLLSLAIFRIKRPLVYILTAAVQIFFLTIAACYSFANGYQLVYFLLLVSQLGTRAGLAARLIAVVTLGALILAVHINPQAIFPGATTNSAQLFMLTSFTGAQVAGFVLALTLLALTRRLTAKIEESKS